MDAIKKLIVGAAAAMTMSAGVVAADFGTVPASYKAEVETYVSSRLENSRAARFQFVGSPYKVYADISGYQDIPAWAVDVRVRSRLPSGGFSGYMPYTVIFVDGEPVALEEDAVRLTRL